MKTMILSAAYFSSGLLFIYSSYRPLGINGLFLKALIIPFLLAIFLLNAVPQMASAKVFIVAALLFSWTGDIFLQLRRDRGRYFVPGLAAFLMAHICYTAVFVKQQGNETILHNRTWILIPVIIYGFGLILFLYNNLGKKKVPVIIYSITILCMLTSALSIYGKVDQRSFLLVISGALLFVISDSVLAINRFGHRFRAAQACIMTTYVTGQFLIIMGYLLSFRNDLV